MTARQPGASTTPVRRLKNLFHPPSYTIIVLNLGISLTTYMCHWKRARVNTCIVNLMDLKIGKNLLVECSFIGKINDWHKIWHKNLTTINNNDITNRSDLHYSEE